MIIGFVLTTPQNPPNEECAFAALGLTTIYIFANVILSESIIHISKHKRSALCRRSTRLRRSA
jgi:hypothetical protein